MATEVEATRVVDKQMKEVFDWSDDETPVRDALWNFYMEKNNHDTDQTTRDMAPIITMGDEEAKALATKLLKK